MQNKFTASAKNILKKATAQSASLGHAYIGTEHLLLAMLCEKGSMAENILSGRGIGYETTRALVEELSGMEEVGTGGGADMTPGLRRVLENAARCAEKYEHLAVGTEDILLSLLSEKESVAVKLIVAQSVSVSELQNDVLSFFGSMSSGTEAPTRPATRGGNSVVLQYGRDLTAFAACGLLDPIIGREKETERVIQILSRRTKNNPCLIGEPGVGKTAVVEGLAARIAMGTVPENLADKTVVTLDISAMVAGAKYRGEFEDRLKKVMEEVARTRRIILFIDEIHTIVGAGAAEGAVDAANILKPVLARGEIQVIGATTIAEYRRHIEKDAALERRFQPILVCEPSEEEALEILRGLRGKYESHHHVTIRDEALVAAVRLSRRYIPDRFLPDKALDLLDEAAAGKRIAGFADSPTLLACEERIKNLSAQKDAAIYARNFELAATLRENILHEERNLRILKEKERQARERERMEIGEEEIADIVTSWTKIPVKRLAQTESERLLHLESLLREKIIGQDNAISAVARAIRRGRMGLGNPARPICSLLFMGPTGVGKTELAKAVADIVFGSTAELIRVDMSEYMEKHSVSRLLGSPPGYVGCEEGAEFPDRVRRHPYSVILFDEIEKAHPDVFNLFLQILDDGILTDSQGRTTSFKNAIIIMTTNLGASTREEGEILGFSVGTTEERKKTSAARLRVLRESFRPEFINRIDEIVVFDALNREALERIATLMLREVKERIAALGMEVIFDPSVAASIASCDAVKQYGARPMRREISARIEDAFSVWILDGKLHEGDRVRVLADDTGELRFETVVGV